MITLLWSLGYVAAKTAAICETDQVFEVLLCAVDQADL